MRLRSSRPAEQGGMSSRRGLEGTSRSPLASGSSFTSRVCGVRGARPATDSLTNRPWKSLRDWRTATTLLQAKAQGARVEWNSTCSPWISQSKNS